MSSVIPGSFEADGCVVVTFNVTNANGTVIIHTADVGTGIAIEGLKEDMQHAFGIPAEYQRWFQGAAELQSQKTLQEYGFDGKKVKKAAISVLAH